MESYIDSHAHIYVDRFKNDLDDVINRSLSANVRKILMPNIDSGTVGDVFEVWSTYPDTCLPMIGLHPCSVDERWRNTLDEMEDHLSKEGIVAIGESGIDLYWDKSFQKEQEASFDHQIGWSRSAGLPIVIHSRSSMDRTISMIKERQDGGLSGVFHCFDQSIDEAQAIIDMGFYVGIGGIITYKKNEGLRQTVAQIPLDNILLETDAPYLPPVPYRGKRNESSYIPIIAKTIAEIKDIDIDEVARVTTRNAEKLFNLKD